MFSNDAPGLKSLSGGPSSLFIATSSFGFHLQTTNMANKAKTEQGILLRIGKPVVGGECGCRPQLGPVPVFYHLLVTQAVYSSACVFFCCCNKQDEKLCMGEVPLVGAQQANLASERRSRTKRCE